jgi:hypothetical protein
MIEDQVSLKKCGHTRGKQVSAGRGADENPRSGGCES